LDRAKFLAKLHNVDISRLQYVYDFVYLMFIAQDPVLVNRFEEEYVPIYSAEEFRTKVVPEAIIQHRVSIAVSEAVSKAAREMAKELIRLPLPLKDVAKVTKLSIKEVKSIKDGFVKTLV
jgi:hypothetical protein